MDVYWAAFSVGIAIIGIMNYQNGRHILEHGEVRFKWSHPKDKPATDLVGRMYIISGLLWVPSAICFLITLLVGDSLSTDSQPDSLAFLALAWLLGSFIVLNILTAIALSIKD